MTKSFRVVHASGNTFMSLDDTKDDVVHILNLKPAPLWVTITEAGEPETISAISRAIRRIKAPYNLLNPDRGDVAFLIHHDARLKDSGGPLAIAGQPGPAREGGHGPRRNSWVELEWGNETIFVNGVHLVTRFPGNGDRSEEQDKQATQLGLQMRAQAHGRNLSVGSGDLNGQLPERDDLQAIFDKFGMTTTAQETGNMTGTHERSRLDYVWTMDKDRRVHVEEMRVWKNPKINSDHDPIIVDLLIS